MKYLFFPTVHIHILTLPSLRLHQGENPFLGNQDDQDPDDSMAMDGSEAEAGGQSLPEAELKDGEEEPKPEGNGTHDDDGEDAAPATEEPETERTEVMT